MAASGMLRRRTTTMVTVLACAAALLPGTTAGAASGKAGGGDPELGPLISGTSSYVDGTFVWTDYAYDDRGPNDNIVPGGDAAYPDNPHPQNTADIVQLQLGTVDSGALRVAFVLNTLVQGGEADLGVGFDTDRDVRTGSPGVPGDGWGEPPAVSLVRPPLVGRAEHDPLGLEHMVVLATADATGTLLTWDAEADAWQGGATFPIDVDRDRNVVSAEIAGLRPGAQTWRAVGLAGMADEGGSWVNGAHPVLDLAFLRAEDPVTETAVALTYQVPQIRSHWQDERQADVLAGHRPASEAVTAVTFGTDRTALAQPQAPGLDTFLYHSRVDLGEGIRQSPLRYQGRYQPYVVFIPAGLEADGVLPRNAPAIIFLHGANQNHLTNAVHFAREGLVIPGTYDEAEAIVVFPHGRDTGWGTGPAHQDALDATDDAIARLDLDTDRIVLSGVSAGGSGTFNLGARYPDRWAGLYPMVGGGTSLAPNLTNLPVRTHYAGPAERSSWESVSEVLAADGLVDFHAAWVATKVHMPVPMGNCWFRDLLARPRDLSPARVRYVVPSPITVDAATVLAPDSAYWVSDLVSNEGARGSIDVTSLARADRDRVGTDFAGEHHNIVTSEDFCGPREDMQTADAWIDRGRVLEPAEAAPASNGLAIVLSDLRSGTVDLGPTAVRTDEPLLLEVTGDGPTDLTLAGDWVGSYELTRDGQRHGRLLASDGRLVVPIDGSATYRIDRAP